MKFLWLLGLMKMSLVFGQESISYQVKGEKWVYYYQKNILAQFPSLQQSEKNIGVELKKISAKDFQKILLKKNIASNSSPVFSDNAEGGVLRALSGGVVVFFKKELGESELQHWLEKNNLQLEKRLSTPLGIEVKTAPGLDSLRIQQQISLLPEVDFAEPNWWVESKIKKIPLKSDIDLINFLRQQLGYPRFQETFVEEGGGLWKKLFDQKVLGKNEQGILFLKESKYFSLVRNYPQYEIKGIKIKLCQIDFMAPLVKLKEGENHFDVSFKVLEKNPLSEGVLAQEASDLCPPQRLPLTLIKKGKQLRLKN